MQRNKVSFLGKMTYLTTCYPAFSSCSFSPAYPARLTSSSLQVPTGRLCRAVTSLRRAWPGTRTGTSILRMFRGRNSSRSTRPPARRRSSTAQLGGRTGSPLDPMVGFTAAPAATRPSTPGIRKPGRRSRSRRARFPTTSPFWRMARSSTRIRIRIWSGDWLRERSPARPPSPFPGSRTALRCRAINKRCSWPNSTPTRFMDSPSVAMER